MANCVNPNTKEFKALAEQSNMNPIVLAAKVSLWQESNGLDKFPTLEDLLKPKEINYNLKAVNILASSKGVNMFSKGLKNNWTLEKILTELQVPKDQKQLILDSGKTNIDDIVIDLLANYSYAIEINTTKNLPKGSDYSTYTTDQQIQYVKVSDNDYRKRDLENGGSFIAITKKEFEDNQSTPTNFYSSLTVPGGTNYTENEIATPAITPSIKGHAQFSTDKGIGWFRSDEQTEGGKYYPGGVFEGEMIASTTEGGILTKIRRILEIQSDLFQKGRDKKNLTFTPELSEFKEGNIVETSKGKFEILGTEYNLEKKTYYKKLKNLETGQIGSVSRENFLKSLKLDTQNQFLQLLNKDNNWVTFFIKSIIQDSAKKGYEKVLFPSGNTASKVEGHTTLEEFKKQKEDRIKELEEKRNFTIEESKFAVGGDLTPNVHSSKIRNKFKTRKEAEDFLNNSEAVEEEKLPTSWKVYDISDKIKNELEPITNEINQLKQELERVEKEGFGALKPIYNFYENTVKNVLNKQYGKENVKQITDEYGNTWNEVTVSEQEVDLSIDLFSNTGIDVSYDLRNEFKNEVVGATVREYQALTREHLAFKFSTDKQGNPLPYLEVHTPRGENGPTQIIIKETAVKIKENTFAGVASTLIEQVNKAVLHPDAIEAGKTVGTINPNANYIIDIQAFPEYILNYAMNYSDVTAKTNSSAIKYNYLSKFLESKGLLNENAAQLAKLYEKGHIQDIIADEKKLLQERASIKMEVYEEDFSISLEEDLSIDLSYNNNDGIYANPDFNRVKKKRKSQIAILDTRIEKLKDFRKTKGEIESITSRINYLTRLKIELEQDLKNLQEAVSEEQKFNQVKQIFDKDIAQVKELLKNPTIENVAIAKDMIDYIEINSDQENEDSIFGIEKGELTNPTITTLKEYLHTEKQDLKTLYETATDELLLDYLEPIKENLFKIFPKTASESDRDALARIRDVELKKNIADIDALETQLLSQGDNILSETDIYAKMQVLMYETELHKTLAEATVLKQRLNAILPELENKLRELGYVSKGTIDYLNYISLFYSKNKEGFSEPYLVSKFTTAWDNYLFTVNRETREALKTLFSDPNKKGIQAEIDDILMKKYLDLDDKAEFVDFRYLHEVLENVPFFDNPFYKRGTSQEAEAYKQELISKIGETEYQEIVRKQTNFLREFREDADAKEKKFLKDKGVENYDELSDREQDLLDNIINRIDPFVFLDSHTTGNKLYVPYVQGYTNNHYMTYNTLIPRKETATKKEKTSFYDTNFEVIEKDPILNEAWKIMKDIVESNNINLIGSGLNLNKKSLLWFKKSLKEELLNKSWKNTLTRQGIVDAFRDTISFIKNLAAAPTQKDTTSNNIVLPTHIASFKKQIDETHKMNTIAVASLFKAVITPKTKINFNNLNAVDKISLFETLGVIDEVEFKQYVKLDKDGNFDFKSLYEIAKKTVFENQTLDLPLMLKVQLEQAAIHAARSKTKEKLDVVLHKAKQQKQKQKGPQGESLPRPNAQKKTDFWVKIAIENKPTLNHKGTKFNLMSSWAKKIKKAEENNMPIPLSEWKKGLGFWAQSLSVQERKDYQTILDRLGVIQQLLAKLDGSEASLKIEENLLNEKAKLEQHIRLLGKDFMASVLLTNTLTTYQLVKGMYYNYVSPVFNYINARVQLKNRDGEFWPVGYSDIALAFVDMRSARVFDKNYAKQWSIGEAIIERLNVISDATNEFQRGERRDVGGSPKFFGKVKVGKLSIPAPNKKFITDPLFGTAAVEYFNQVPAFYAHALNKSIKNVNTEEEVRFFDGNSFVAYDIDSATGKVILKPEFDSEQNREDFLNFTSDAAASWVSEIKTSIDSLNGKYRNSGVTMIKSTVAGKQLMAFKTWFPKLLESKFAYNQLDINTGEIRDGHVTGSLMSSKTKAQGVSTLMQITATNAVFGAVALAGFSGGVVAIASAIIALGSAVALPTMAALVYNKVRNNVVRETPGIYVSLARGIQQTLLTNTVGMIEMPTNAAYAMLKKLRIVNNLNKQGEMKTPYLINPYAMIANHEKLSKRELQNIRGMVSTAVLSAYSSIIIALMAELGGDDEEKEQKGEEGSTLREWSEKQAQKELDKKSSNKERARIGFKNAAGRILGEVTTGYDPLQTLKMFIGDESTALEGSPAFVEQLGEAFLREAFSDGEADILTDPNSMYYGDSKSSLFYRRNLLFSPIKNIDKKQWLGGVESLTEKDYYKTNYEDWFNETDLKSDQKKFKPIKLQEMVGIRDEVAQKYLKKDFTDITNAKEREDVEKEAQKIFKNRRLSPKGAKEGRGFYTQDQKRKTDKESQEYFKSLE